MTYGKFDTSFQCFSLFEVQQHASLWRAISTCRADQAPITDHSRSKITIREYAAYYLHTRSHWPDDNRLFHFRKLFEVRDNILNDTCMCDELHKQIEFLKCAFHQVCFPFFGELSCVTTFCVIVGVCL